MTSPTAIIFRRAEVDGQLVDVVVARGHVVGVGPGAAAACTARAGESSECLIVDAMGGALLPGLHDHHAHLLATAALHRSVHCGPPSVLGGSALRRALLGAETAAEGWIRGVGYHESVAGRLDRHWIDQVLPDIPVRIQHASGALWVLNTAGMDILAPRLDRSSDVERDAAGTPNGRLWRYDVRLRTALGDTGFPSLAGVGQDLAACGITGVTDATPTIDQAAAAHLARSVSDGTLPLDLQLLSRETHDTIARVGPVKIVVSDHQLPGLDDLVGQIRSAHTLGRAVAIHSVTRASVVLTLAALEVAGAVEGDRLEHGAVIPTELLATIDSLGLRVVTQPGFIAHRGDRFRRDVDPRDLPILYPYRSLLDSGIRVAPSSDQPHGPGDPWEIIRSAATRNTESGHCLTPSERVEEQTVLNGFLSPLDDPGGPPRRVRPGAPADLCLLRVGLARALAEPSRDLVRMTLRAGTVVYRNSEHR